MPRAPRPPLLTATISWCPPSLFPLLLSSVPTFGFLSSSFVQLRRGLLTLPPRPPNASFAWCRDGLTRSLPFRTSARRATMMHGVTNWVRLEQDYIHSLSLYIHSALLSGFLSQRFRTPKRRLRNLTTGRSSSKANWHVKFLHSPAGSQHAPLLITRIGAITLH